ncbi:MAG: hypothetical protein M3Z08_21335, partial [Chloroflexota bacterium]|nr:hypothetical protein [Chloroflexota bacterium]
ALAWVPQVRVDNHTEQFNLISITAEPLTQLQEVARILISWDRAKRFAISTTIYACGGTIMHSSTLH